MRGSPGIHTWVRVGGKTCMVDHYHDGSGTGSTRARAQASAIRAWVDFTAWEYGRAWGSYAAAAGKSMSCNGSGGSWSCNASARPCRYRELQERAACALQRANLVTSRLHPPLTPPSGEARVEPSAASHGAVSIRRSVRRAGGASATAVAIAP